MKKTLSLIIEMTKFGGAMKVVNTRHDCGDDKNGGKFVIQRKERKHDSR